MSAEIAAAIALLTKIVPYLNLVTPALSAVQSFGPAIVSAGQVLSGQITGQAALDDIAAKEAACDALIAHIDAEGAKLGQ